MTVMRSFKWSILCLVLLAGSGCSKNVRYLGGRIKNDIIRRGVSLSPGATEVVLGDTHVALEGRTASDDYPSTAKSVPVIMTGIKPNYEKIAQIRPDAVFYDPALFSQADLDKFKELKIKTFPIGGNNLDDFETSVYRVGSESASETEASAYVELINKALGEAASLKPAVAPTVMVLLPGTGGEHMILGTDSFLADVIAKVGGKVVGPKGTNYQAFNAESALKEDPQIILIPGNPKTVVEDARLRSTTAFKKGNVFQLKPDIALREGGRVNILVTDISHVFARAKK